MKIRSFLWGPFFIGFLFLTSLILTGCDPKSMAKPKGGGAIDTASAGAIEYDSTGVPKKPKKLIMSPITGGPCPFLNSPEDIARYNAQKKAYDDYKKSHPAGTAASPSGTAKKGKPAVPASKGTPSKPAAGVDDDRSPVATVPVATSAVPVSPSVPATPDAVPTPSPISATPPATETARPNYRVPKDYFNLKPFAMADIRETGGNNRYRDAISQVSAAFPNDAWKGFEAGGPRDLLKLQNELLQSLRELHENVRSGGNESAARDRVTVARDNLHDAWTAFVIPYDEANKIAQSAGREIHHLSRKLNYAQDELRQLEANLRPADAGRIKELRGQVDVCQKAIVLNQSKVDGFKALRELFCRDFVPRDLSR